MSSILSKNKLEDIPIYIGYKLNDYLEITDISDDVATIDTNKHSGFLDVSLRENKELHKLYSFVNLTKINKFSINVPLDITLGSSIGTNLKGINIDCNNAVTITFGNQVKVPIKNLTLKCNSLMLHKTDPRSITNLVNFKVNTNCMIFDDFSNMGKFILGNTSYIQANSVIIHNPQTMDYIESIAKQDIFSINYCGFKIQNHPSAVVIPTSKNYGYLLSKTEEIPTKSQTDRTYIIGNTYVTPIKIDWELVMWVSNHSFKVYW